ncbi:restriction endonuclease subunit S [Pontibacter locisalis]|uniref:Restriction endonuclease subunit S n=1 Tax=Pontibacter locisalis TaxID=1719035 RepID=A0ABW5IQ87_9BACT
MYNWNTYNLGTLCTKVTSGGTPLRSKKEFYENGKIPWLKTKEVANCRVYNAENKITQLGLEKSSAKLIPPNSVIVAMYGDGETAGRVAINKIPLATNQACCNLIIDSNKADYEFIYYYLLNSYDYLVNLKSGSGQQNLSGAIIKEVEVILPDLPTQRRIAEILSALDDKIELNRRMNQTLEQMAQTLFRQYFVDGIDEENLPEGWKTEPLDEVANFLNGLALQKYKPKDEKHFLPIIKIRELKNGITSSTEKADVNIPSQYIIHDGDILFSWSGTLEADIWCHGDGALNQHLFKVTSDKFPKWFYYYWVKEHLREFQSIAASKATTMGHIKRSHLSEAIVYTSPEEHLSKANNVIAPLLDKIVNCKVEIRRLIKLRDTLLPKLMSGEIDVMQLKTDEQHEPILS